MTPLERSTLLRRLLTSLYRMSLLRYPRRLRRRHGADMVTAFGRLFDEEVAAHGAFGVARLGARILRDLLRPLPRPLAGQSGGSFQGLFPGELGSALRSLRRAPGFTALLIGVLALGVAFNVTVLSVINAYLLRPLPFPEPGRLVEVRPATAAVNTENSGDVFEKAVSWNLDGFTLVGDGPAEVVLGAQVSPDFFETFGVTPALGRVFGRGEARQGVAPPALISHDLWVRRFGGDAGVLGRTLRAYPADAEDDVVSYTVVGVLPRGFWYLNRYAELLTPLEGGPVYTARLRSDMPPERAEEVLTARARAADPPRPPDFRVRVQSLQDAYTAGVRPTLLTLQTAALLVLLVGCANAGLLLLVRAAGRRREWAVRQALGAGRGRIAAHVLWEGLTLSLASGAVGVGLSVLALSLGAGAVQERLGRGVPGGLDALQIDLRVCLVTLFGCVAVGLAFGSVPRWATGGNALGRLLRSGDRGTSDGTGANRLRGALTVMEVALSLTLLTGAGVMVRSAHNLYSQPLGFETEGLTAFTVGLTTPGSESEIRRLAFFRALEERARTLPGVDAVGVARGVPFASSLVTRQVEAEAGTHPDVPVEAVPQVVSPSYFSVLDLSPTHGRLLTDEDRPGAVPAAVVSASLAARLWPGGSSPLGRRVRFTAWTMPEMDEAQGPWLTVVGVVPDVSDGIEGGRPTLYVPHGQAAMAWMTLLVRRRPGVAGRSVDVQGILGELDPHTPVYDQADLSEVVGRARAPARFFAALLGGFSLFSLVMAVMGLYGVAAYAARQRRRDVAVRIALGAGAGAVERTFILHSAGPVALGMGMGLAGGRLLTASLRDQLHGVSPGDPGVALGVAALLGATAVLAIWLPARSAARVDPMVVLREE